MCALLSALVLWASALHAVAAAGSNVVDLTKNLTNYGAWTEGENKSFDNFVQRLQKSFVYFYTPYCGHCKVVSPGYEQVASYIEPSAPWIQFAKVDCLEAFQFCESQGIKAYPMLREYYGEDSSAATGLAGEYVGSQDVLDRLKDLSHGRLPYSPKPKPPSKAKASPVPAPNPSPHATAANSFYRAENGSTAIVKMEVPGAPYAIQQGGSPSSIILNFTISQNGHHLLLNDQLFALLVPDPSIPPRLSALQVFADAELGKSGPEKQYKDFFRLGARHTQWLVLDYEFEVTPRDDATISYHHHVATLKLNFIGAQDASHDDSPNFLLDSPDQKILQLKLRQHHPGGGWNDVSSTDPYRNYVIDAVKFLDRPSDYAAPQPRDARVCDVLSWRCADIDDAPWYRRVWRFQFDECGRIGSLRRRVLLARVVTPPATWCLLLPACGILLAWKAWQVLRRRRLDVDKPLPPLPFEEKKEDSVK